MPLQNTGEQMDEDSGDLTSFGNERQSRVTVKPAQWTSINPWVFIRAPLDIEAKQQSIPRTFNYVVN